jgi:hypothetical protein
MLASIVRSRRFQRGFHRVNLHRPTEPGAGYGRCWKSDPPAVESWHLG